jgi:conjugal transfer mating pair stabilization protein TraG
MMVWEIYSYWNIEELRGVLEAVTMLTSTSDYGKLISTMILFGIAVVGIANLTGKHDVVEGFRWFFVAIFLYFVMFVPKVDVTLIDRTGTEPAKVVNNVPIALGVFGHTTSKIGDWLTTSYETVMGVITPSYITYDGVKFEGNGLLFGEQVLLNSEMAEPENISFRMNMTSFFDKCVFPEFDTGNIPIQNVLNTNDLWAAIGNVNPSLYVQLYNNDGTPTPAPIDCMTAYTTVLPAMLTNASNAMLQKLGNKNYPDMSDAAAKAAIESVIAGSYGYYLGLSSSASDIIKQQIMTNTFYNATADPGTLTAATMAQQAAEKNYSVLFHVAQNTIPKLRNVIEVILYAMFPVIMVMIVVGGIKGFPVIKSFVIGLFWIQLWAPLYAVMNYLVTSYDRKEFMAHVTLGDEISASHSAAISDMVLSNTELAGMLAMSIPIIAYAIVKGGEMAMTSFVSGSTRPIEQNAAMSSREVSQGNISMGNMSMDNKGFNTVSALDYNMQPSVNNGMIQSTNASGYQSMVGADGAQYGAAPKNDMPLLNVQSAMSSAQGFDKKYTESLDASKTLTDKAEWSTGSSFGTSGSVSNVLSNKDAITSDMKEKYGADFAQGLESLQAFQSDLQNKLGLSQKESADLAFGAGGAAKGGLSLESGAYLEAKANISKKYGEDAAAQFESMVKGLDQDKLQSSAKFMDGFSKDEGLQNAFGLSQDQKNELKSGTDTSQSYANQAEAKLKESEEFRQSRDYSEKKLQEAMIDLGAATPLNAQSDVGRAFLYGQGAEMLMQAGEAKRTGNANEYNNIMQDFNHGYQEAVSAVPGGPTVNNIGEVGGRADIYNDHGQNQLSVHDVHLQNETLVDGDKYQQQNERDINTGRGRIASEEQWKDDVEAFDRETFTSQLGQQQTAIDSGIHSVKENSEAAGLGNVSHEGGQLRNDKSQLASVASKGVDEGVELIKNAAGDSAAGKFIGGMAEDAGSTIKSAAGMAADVPDAVFHASSAAAGNKDSMEVLKGNGDNKFINANHDAGHEISNKYHEQKDADPEHSGAPGTGVSGTDAYIDGPEKAAQKK